MTPADPFAELRALLSQNPALDPATANLVSGSALDALDWRGLSSRRDALVDELRAYQRLARLLPAPAPALIFALLAAGVRSAIQVATMSRAELERLLGPHTGGDARLCQQVQANAQAIRSRVALRYVRSCQLHDRNLPRTIHNQ